VQEAHLLTTNEQDLKQRLRVLQIIAIALALGPLVFMAIAIFLFRDRASRPGFERPSTPLLTYVALGGAEYLRCCR
jgi:hypothetical protein